MIIIIINNKFELTEMIQGIMGASRGRKTASTSRGGSSYCFCDRMSCTGLVELVDSSCIVAREAINELKMLIENRRLRGVIVTFTPVNVGSALRRIETRLIELKIQLERRPDNYVIQKRIEILEKLAESMKMGRLPLKTRIVFIVSGGDMVECRKGLRELRSLYAQRGCSPRIVPFTRLAQILTHVRGTIVTSDYALSTLELLGDISYNTSMEYSVPIGWSISENSIVFLSLWDKGAQHVLVVGPTGKGKTTLLATLINRLAALAEDVGIVAIDPKGDLAKNVVVEEKVVFRPEYLSSLMKNAYEKGILPASSLADILGMERDEEIVALAKVLEKLCDSEERNPPSPIDIVVREKLRSHGLRLECSGDSRAKLGEILESIASTRSKVVLDLSLLPDSLKNIVIWIVVSLVMETIEKEPATRLRKILVIDEAWRLQKAPAQLLQRVFKEGRSYGVAVILATQDPSDLSEEVWNNAQIVIAFGSQDDEYISSISRVFKLAGREQLRVRLLRRGEVLVKTPNREKPLLAYIEPELG